jgi:hypothetical protein
VIAFTPMIDDRSLKAIADIHARGFPVVLIDVLPEGEVAPGRGPEAEIAHRVWRLQREAARFEFETQGIPVVRWSGDRPLDASVAALPPLRRRPRARRA